MTNIMKDDGSLFYMTNGVFVPQTGNMKNIKELFGEDTEVGDNVELIYNDIKYHCTIIKIGYDIDNFKLKITNKV